MNLRTTLLGGVAVCAALASSCSVVTDRENDDRTGTDEHGTGAAGGPVVLVTHDSFSLPKKLVAQFEEETGYTLDHQPAGDGGQLTNELVLTQGDPLGDVAFGVDNTYASRALDEGVFQPYDGTLPPGAEDLVLEGDDEHALAPIDTGSVCVNVDTAWFEDEGLEPPQTLDDLTDPAYEGLFVTPAATSSTPGMAFLLATIAEYGDAWPSYWEDLLANDAKIVKGWEDAYYVDFSFSGGDRPIVLSYDTSPAFTVSKDGSATSTAALLDTCFRQVEYAGILEGADNPEGARAVIDWLLSPEVQEALPTSMYVFPVDPAAELPEDWARFAEQPSTTLEVSPADITEHRQEWLTEWTDITSR